MKRKLLFGMSMAFLAFTASAQTIVSTSPENKKVILEEFTGINCVYCPDGHAIAQGIKDANEGNVFLINIHQGSFSNPSGSQPDFRTQWGNAIAGQTGLTGYPSGTVNRHVFSGSNTALSRGAWTGASNNRLNESSYLNMAVEANIDIQTNELTVHVEMYYTGDSPVATNKLNVVLLQNNTLGPQTGGGAGNDYVHQHRLVDMITGQWGEDITTTTTGSFVDKNYTYTIPTDYNGIATELADMEIVVFATETTQEIISGNGAIPSYTGLTANNDANARSIEAIDALCVNNVAPIVNVQNLGMDTLTAMDIEYTINGGATQTYNWTGSITSLQSENIELPATDFDLTADNTVVVNLPSDENNANNSVDTNFEEAQFGEGLIYLTINTDAYGSEVRWNVRDGAGLLVANGGPYGNNQTINETLELAGDCHVFTLVDTFGDGGGPVTLKDANDLIIYSTSGNYGSGKATNFRAEGTLSVDDTALSTLVMHPNPANDVIFIRNAENASVQIYDVLGKVLVTQENISANQELNVASLAAGTYFVRMTIGNETSTQKLVIMQ